MSADRTKPYPDFPLTRHPRGQWCKKIRGKVHYFGTDWRAALDRYLAERDDLYAGRTPRTRTPGVGVADVLNHFLTDRRRRADAEEMTLRSWSDYHATALEVVAAFGRDRAAADLRPEDFASLRATVAERLGPVALGNWVQRVRTMFRWAFEAGLLEVPVRFGPGFAKPPARVVRLEKAKRGPRLVTAADARKLLDLADPQIRAMILLGLNCGFGQTDCAELPRSAIRGSWIDFPRPKTGVARRCPLWPETVAALADVATVRPDPKDPADGGLVFLTRFGRRWVRHKPKGAAAIRIDSVGQEFAKLCQAAGVQAGGFYQLRRLHRTITDEAGDQPAADLLMGHLHRHISSVYRQTISDERLERVVAHVRKWLGFASCPQE